jgi:hypothetical protein
LVLLKGSGFLSLIILLHDLLVVARHGRLYYRNVLDFFAIVLDCERHVHFFFLLAFEPDFIQFLAVNNGAFRLIAFRTLLVFQD